MYSVIFLVSTYTILLVAAQEILFRGAIKKFKLNKKRTWIYQVIDHKKKKKLQFPSTSFQILNCYMIVHYEYLLPMWVAITILFC